MNVRVRGFLCLACAFALAPVSCVEKAPSIQATKAERAEIVSKKAPTPQHALDFRFGDKVRLIGYDLEHSPVVPDQPFKVTWYWQVDKAFGEGFEIFTHGADSRSKNRLNLDAARALRSVYPVERWQAGDFIKDTQEVTLPEDWRSDAVVFYLGFYSSAARVPITAGKHDNESRAEVLRVPVRVGPEAKPLARIVARRIAKPIVLDGKLDEVDWQAAQPTGLMLNTMNGQPGGFPAQARVAYDTSNLYVGFSVGDEDLISKFDKNDDHLWEQDCVEIMIDPDGDAKNYFEIQVSPRGVTFDTRYDRPRDPQPFGHVDWSSQIQAKVVVDGTLNDGANDKGYTVELAMPWSAFAVGATPAAVPSADTTWRMNFFVMNSEEHGQRAVGWSAPLVGDFHTLARFGRVVFPVSATFVPPAVTSVPGTSGVSTTKPAK